MSVDDRGKADLWPRRVALVAVLLVLGHLAAVLLLPMSAWPRGVSELVPLVVDVLVSAVTLYALRRTRQRGGPARGVWAALSAAQVCATAGDAAYAVGVLVPGSAPLIEASNGIYLLASLGFLSTFVVIVSLGYQGWVQRLTTLLDVGTASVAAVLLAWAFAVGPALSNTPGSAAYMPAVVTGVSVIGIVPLFVFIQLLAVRSPLTRVRTLRYLVGSAIAYALAGSTFVGAANPLDAAVAASLADTFWLMASVLIGLAAVGQVVHPFVPATNGQDPGRRASLAALILPCGSMVAAYTLLVWRFDHPVAIQSTVLALGVGAILALVLVRLVLAVAEGTRLYGAAQIELHQRERAEVEVRHLNRELEQRVHERTMALSDANRQLQAEVAERTQAEQRIAASLKEKEVLLQEIHHRVKNNLQIVASLLNLQSQSVHDPGALAAFQESQHRIRAMALLHERLYRSHDLARIDFGAYVEDLVNHLARSYLRQAADVMLVVDASDVALDLDAAVPCGLIVNELVSNALKHAFPDGRPGTISVRAERDQDHHMRLVVSDDGIGLPAEPDQQSAPTLGLQLVDALVSQLDGTLTVRRDHGTHLELVFPSA